MAYGYGRQFSIPVADAAPETRAEFIKKTYAHLGGAVLLFAALEYMLFSSGVAESLTMSMLGGRSTWLLIMVLFMGAAYAANWFADPRQSRGMQYLGLGLYVVAETLIFVPILFIAQHYSDANIIGSAMLYTAIVFGGLTGVVFLTGKDFSFLRGILAVGCLASLGTIVCSLLFGFQLGTLFCGLMVALAAGYILYHTSNVLHRYPVGAHVAAALQLFASVALLFWYILQILMSNNRR